jgi:carboxypeptidase T
MKIKTLIFTFILLALQSPYAHSLSKYENVKDALKDIVLRFPQNAIPVLIGDSDSGEAVVGLQIGHGPVNNLIVATHHGNEYGSTEVSLAFANALAQDPLPEQTVFVVPVLNISGFNSNNRRELNGRATFDPNRDYPGPCATEGPFKLKSTLGLAKFIESRNVVASATLHTFQPAVAYPWGVSTRDASTPYDSLFSQLAQAATAFSHYPYGNSTKLIYAADGTYEDYSFWKLGMWTLLFEMGRTHSPSPQQVQQLIQENVPGLHEFLLKAPRVRAIDHAFTAQCEHAFNSLDRHDE